MASTLTSYYVSAHATVPGDHEAVQPLHRALDQHRDFDLRDSHWTELPGDRVQLDVLVRVQAANSDEAVERVRTFLLDHIDGTTHVSVNAWLEPMHSLTVHVTMVEGSTEAVIEAIAAVAHHAEAVPGESGINREEFYYFTTDVEMAGMTSRQVAVREFQRLVKLVVAGRARYNMCFHDTAARQPAVASVTTFTLNFSMTAPVSDVFPQRLREVLDGDPVIAVRNRRPRPAPSGQRTVSARLIVSSKQLDTIEKAEAHVHEQLRAAVGLDAEYRLTAA